MPNHLAKNLSRKQFHLKTRIFVTRGMTKFMGTPSKFGMRYPESSGSCNSMKKNYHGVRNY